MHTLSRTACNTRNKQQNSVTNPTQRNSELKPTTMSKKKGIRQWTTIQLYIGNTRAREKKLVDGNIDALKLSTLLTQVKYILMWIVNVDKLPD